MVTTKRYNSKGETSRTYDVDLAFGQGTIHLHLCPHGEGGEVVRLMFTHDDWATLLRQSKEAVSGPDTSGDLDTAEQRPLGPDSP